MKIKRAFTLIELLVVVSIIALLVGIIVPALNVARRMGRVATVKATFNAIEMGLNQFRNDQGSFPSSNMRLNPGPVYLKAVAASGGGTEYILNTDFWDIGTHRLFEAMAGQDMLGYDTQTIYRTYSDRSTDARAQLYVDATKMKIGSLSEVIKGTSKLPSGTFKSSLAIGNKAWENPNSVFLDTSDPQKPTPILYFKATPTRTFLTSSPEGNFTGIYDILNNYHILVAYGFDDTESNFNPNAYLYNSSNLAEKISARNWPQYIWDTKTGIDIASPPDEQVRLQSTTARPYNPDTFLLISGGPDGIIGTQDDITNFERR